MIRLPTCERGPRGSRLVVDGQGAVPLVWFQVAIPGGSAGDPPGAAGFTHHMARLARRGAGSRDRHEFDRTLDELGASLTVTTERDAFKLSGLCLRRNLEQVIGLAADVLARPHLDQDEHDKLVRETRMSLDEIRDDDTQLAARYFSRYCVPGHPYARTIIGTERSLGNIDLDAVGAAYRRAVVPENLIIGLAGDITTERAHQLAARLVADLPGTPAAPLPSVTSPAPPTGRRLLVVDKPERTQTQIMIGHLGPRYGVAESAAFVLVETIFGGSFTSRLMQEIRVKRGWSYGADCHFFRSRGRHWFRLHLAPSAEVAPEAVALALSMLESLAADGVTDSELEFARNHLAGSLPFRLATPGQRVRLVIRSRILGLPDDFAATLPERLAEVDRDQANAAARRWLRPDDALAVVVATADSMLPRLREIHDGDIEVLPYRSY